VDITARRKLRTAWCNAKIDLRETAKALADEQKAHDDQKAVIDALNVRLAGGGANARTTRAMCSRRHRLLPRSTSSSATAQRGLEEVSIA